MGREVDQTATFNAHERLFWRVLSTLARHGYVAPADEGKDLIHDFFVDAWEGLLRRFDRDRGDFEVYLASAFYKFARRRIVSLQEWRYRLVDIEAAAELESPDQTPAQSLEANQQLAALTCALSKLPSLERQALYEYVRSESHSERSVARKFSMSRYALRETLANGLGRLAVSLRGSTPEDSVESKVAECLWADGRSVRSAAAHLGLSTREVTNAKDRYIEDLLTALRHQIHGSSALGRTAMPAIELLLHVIHVRPEDRTGSELDKIRDNASSILEALERRDEPLEYGDVSHSEAGREWIARVYSSLAGGETDSREDSPIAAAMEDLRSSEEREIGEAFAQLCSGLRRLSRWSLLFGELPRVDDDVKELLRQDDSVAASGEYGEQLVDMGLTPTMFFGATRSMQLMFNRANRAVNGRADDASLRRWRELGEPFVRLHFDSAMIGVPEVVLRQQISGVQNLPAQAAAPMVHWTLEALADRPYFVAGYQYDVGRRVFEPTARKWAEDPQALMGRWSARG